MNARNWRDFAARGLSGSLPPVDDLSHVERDAFVSWIAARRLAPLLLHVVGLLQSEEMAKDLTAAARREVVFSALQERELRRLWNAFAAAGVSPILLKGAALAYSVYPDPALRPRNDVDFFIRDDHEPVIRRILADLGYEPALDIPSRRISTQFHYARTDPMGMRHACDVHVKLSNSLPYADYLTFDAIARRAVGLPRLHPAAVGPAPADCLVIACVHRIAHHYDADDLSWLWDIHLLVSSLGPSDWDRVAASSRDKHLSAVVALGLVRARDAFSCAGCGAQVDFFTSAAQTETPPPLFGPETTMFDVVRADWSALPAGAERRHLLRDHLFPPIHYVRQRYPRWPAGLIPLAYVYRLILGAPKWLAHR